MRASVISNNLRRNRGLISLKLERRGNEFMSAKQPWSRALMEAGLFRCCYFLTIDVGILRMFLDCLFINEFSAGLL